MPELRLPELLNGNSVTAWARDLVFQLRRQWVPLLRRLGPLSPFGLQALDGAGTLFTLPWLKTDTTIVSCTGAATVTAAGLVRPGLTFAVFARNITAVSGAGLTEYKIGTTTPPDDDAWHVGHELVAETLEDTRAWIDTSKFDIAPPVKYDTATDIVLKANGGGVMTTGQIQLYAFTLDFKPTA